MTTDSHPDPHPNRWQDQDATGGADNDSTRAFWGDSAGWESQPTDTFDSGGLTESGEATTPRGGIGATVGRWWSSASSGRRGGTRAHAPATSASSPDETDHGLTPVDDDHDDSQSDWDDAWEAAPPEPPRPGVDPLLARLGGLAVVLTLLVPVVMGFTSDDGEAVRTSPITVDVLAAASGDQPEQPIAASAPVAPSTPAAGATSPLADATVATDPTTTAAVAETPTTAPAVAVDDCALEYDVVVGDFWIRIADGSGATLADVLAVNDATVSTPLYPGGSICLPDGAALPPPPPAPTTAASTSTANSNTRTSSSSSNTSTGSTTPATITQPTTAPAPVSTAGPAEVEAIIRAVWPDELEDRAIEIARRESNLDPSAKNSCCYGLYQVYWSVHRSWLSGLGITSADQLYDPATNSRAALALYERSGGWGPWGG